jgi:hypothetical protein
MYSCVMQKALPQSYRITAACVQNSGGDFTRALICSTAPGLKSDYDRFLQVQDCASDGTAAQVAQCLGQQYLGPKEQKYLNCAVQNNFDATKSAMCMVAQSVDMNAEMQVAVACAATTGGEPELFVGCVAGTLTATELEKCWENGVGTDAGCFGPNNAVRKFWNDVDNQLKNMLGPNNTLYKAYHVYSTNIFNPGPNHEFVKLLNTGLNDLRNGPGPGNEFVKAGKAVERGVQSVGRAIKCVFGC